MLENEILEFLKEHGESRMRRIKIWLNRETDQEVREALFRLEINSKILSRKKGSSPVFYLPK